MPSVSPYGKQEFGQVAKCAHTPGMLFPPFCFRIPLVFDIDIHVHVCLLDLTGSLVGKHGYNDIFLVRAVRSSAVAQFSVCGFHGFFQPASGYFIPYKLGNFYVRLHFAIWFFSFSNISGSLFFANSSGVESTSLLSLASTYSA